MISDTILHKYLRHLRYIDQGSIVHLDAVDLALRLSLEELEESMAPANATAELGGANLRIMELQADLERLQGAVNAEVTELRQQLAQLDTDNASLIRRNKELADELQACREAATWTVQQLAPAHAAIHNTDHPNGSAIATAPPAAIHHTTLNDFASANLTPENYDWWIGLDAGRHTWRNLPKRNRLDLVRYVLSFGPPDAALKMIEFDAIRPQWMPTAGTHTKTFNMTWEQLNDFTVELEATL